MTKNTHGGARPGAGRPPTGRPKPVQISLRLPAELLKKLNSRVGETSRNEFIIQALEAFLK